MSPPKQPPALPSPRRASSASRSKPGYGACVRPGSCSTETTTTNPLYVSSLPPLPRPPPGDVSATASSSRFLPQGSTTKLHRRFCEGGWETCSTQKDSQTQTTYHELAEPEVETIVQDRKAYRKAVACWREKQESEIEERLVQLDQASSSGINHAGAFTDALNTLPFSARTRLARTLGGEGCLAPVVSLFETVGMVERNFDPRLTLSSEEENPELSVRLSHRVGRLLRDPKVTAGIFVIALGATIVTNIDASNSGQALAQFTENAGVDLAALQEYAENSFAGGAAYLNIENYARFAAGLAMGVLPEAAMATALARIGFRAAAGLFFIFKSLRAEQQELGYRGNSWFKHYLGGLFVNARNEFRDPTEFFEECLVSLSTAFGMRFIRTLFTGATPTVAMGEDILRQTFNMTESFDPAHTEAASQLAAATANAVRVSTSTGAKELFWAALTGLGGLLLYSGRALVGQCCRRRKPPSHDGETRTDERGPLNSQPPASYSGGSRDSANRL